ncbi:MAG: ATP-binding protein, partial [Balneolales bacterium]|nr:ATP-binding protein [Balneolales bacterium]
MVRTSVFINRDEELNYLREDIKRKRDKSRFLLISAKSGIGKTALIDKVFSEFTRYKFRVEVTNNESDSISQGFFFKRL